MRLSFLLLAAAPLVAQVSPSSPPSASDVPKADELLERVDARFGDAAARKKLLTMVRRGTVEYYDWDTPDQTSVKGRFEESWLGADRGRRRVEWGKHFFDWGTTGAFTWTSDDCTGVMIFEGDAQASLRRSFDLERRAAWRQHYASAETIGLEAVTDHGGREAWKIAMKPTSGPAETWFVDPKTFDLVAVDTTMPDSPGGTYPVRLLYADFREVAGIRFAFKKTMKLGETPFDEHYDSIEVNAPVKPEQVAPPAQVLEALKDPSKRVQPFPADATECRVDEIAAQPTLSIRLTIAADEAYKTLAVVFPEVIGAVVALGGEMAGPPYVRYHADDGKTIDLEAGLPIKKRVDGKGRVKPSELPAGKAATTWHVGPYESLGTSRSRLRSWMEEKKLESGGGSWVVFWTDPGIEPDPARWRTRVFWPIR